MKRLISEFGWTQDEIAAGIGKSRPAVANSLRLLTLAPEVVGLVESGDSPPDMPAPSSPCPKKNNSLLPRRRSNADIPFGRRNAPSRLS